MWPINSTTTLIFVVLSAILATMSQLCLAQVPYPYTYAPAFSYSTHGTPASTAKAIPHQFLAQAPAVYGHQLPYFFPGPQAFGYNSPNLYFPISTAFSAPLPADPSVQVSSPISETATVELDTPAAVATEVSGYAKENFAIRRIFPVFQSDLRTGSTTVTFARPDQVQVLPITQSESDFVVVGAPTDLNLRSFEQAPAIPAGIVQASQPYFQTRGSIAV
ncbi:hypothetical protein TCAL_15895 [Tigriopus californicus]|uniref:DUF4794 domain-containing protein n=1 Tax=Tigriopus californicus TaxID=6832 RepID=A0A553PHU5_TIGCA|nr:hypothetical protein TCAL_15895 [Tigriopus californicus]